MARLDLTKEWTALDETTGTIQNLSASMNIEVSETNTDSTGQVLYPKQALSFSGVQLYARAITTKADLAAQVRVSPFADAVGGSGGGGGSVTPYILPTASATLKGGVKVGNTMTIDANGVLDAKQPAPYILPPATKSALGGVKVGENLTVDASGVLNATFEKYDLPTASATVKGGAKVGDGLKMTGEILSVDSGNTAGKIVKVGATGKIDSAILPAIATGNTFVEATEAAMLALDAKVGDICVRSDESKSYILQKLPAATLANWVFLQSPTAAVQSVNGKTGTVVIDVPEKVSELENDAGYLSAIPTASATEAGAVKVGNSLEILNGVLDVKEVAIPTASATVKGAVKVGDGLEMDGETLKAVPLAKATTTTLGGIIVGENLTIDADGKLSANAGGYTLPIAAADTLGGVKVGQRMTINIDTGVLDADDQTTTLATVAKTGKYSDLVDAPTEYTLPTASATIKGGVKVGDGLTVTGDVLSVNAIPTGTAIEAGLTKLYTAKGENTDGTMTQKAVKTALDDYYPMTGGRLKGNTINRDVSDNHLVVCGGKNNNDGGAVLLFGKDSTDERKGSFVVRAHSDTAEWNLSGDTAGNLTWGGKAIPVAGDYYPSSGGAISGEIHYSNNRGYLAISGGMSITEGAYIALYGKESTISGFESAFRIGCRNGTTMKLLDGKIDGTLTWDGNKVLTDKVIDGTITNVSGTIQGTCYAKKCGNLVTFYIYTSDSTSLVFAKLPWKPVSPQVFCGLMGNSTSTLQTKLIGVEADGSVRNSHDTTAWKTNIVSGCYFTAD